MSSAITTSTWSSGFASGRRVGQARLACAFALGLAIPACRTPRPPLPENPSGHAYELVVAGNRELGRDAVLEIVRPSLEDFVREDFREAHLDDARWDLERHYRQLGFAFASVTHRLERREETVVAGLFVEEGPRVRLGDIVLSGSTTLPEERLLAHFSRGGLLQAPPFDREAFEGEVESMLEELRDEGFLDVRAEVEYEFADDLAEVTPRVRVEEGRRSVIGEIRIEGNETFSSERLEALLKGFLGGPHSRLQLFRMRGMLLDFHANRGFPFLEIAEETEEDEESGRAAVRFRLREGPKAIVRDVRVEGNEITSAAVVRHRLRVKPGEPFDQSEIRESQERLFASGLFESVRLEVEKADEAGSSVDVVTRVRERRPLFTDFRLGYGSFERARVGATAGTINLFGTGRRLEAGVRASTKNIRGEASFTDPFVFGSDTQLQLKTFDERREEPSFSVDRIGATLSLSRLLYESIHGSVGYGFVNSRAFDLESDIPPREGPRVDVAGFKLTVTRESRKPPANPGSGTFLQFSHEVSAVALGADVNFYRFLFAASAFRSLSESTVLGAGLRGGVVSPFGATKEIPIQERFFSGGESAVRSFREGELGPRTPAGDPLGGEGVTTASIELRQAIVDPFQIAIFVDAGTVTRRAENLFLRGYRFAVGAGLRFVTPIGPLRVDVGRNPNPRQGEDEFVVHVTVGYAF